MPVRPAGMLVVAVLLAPAVARGAANVSSSGCHTTVTTEIEIFGAGASKAVARNIRKGILGCSPGKVGGYSLLGCCKVSTKAKVRVRRKGKGPRPGYNQIEVTNEADFRSYVNGGRDSGKWSSTESGEVYAHEAGHLLGLDDQYDDRTDADGNTVSVTRPGHEMDKMGAKGGKLGIGSAARGSLDTLLLSKGARCNPARCCRRTTTTTLPPGTWTGTLKHVYTDDDTYAYGDAIGSHTRSNHLRTESVWTIIGTTPAVPPEQTVTVDTSWNGSLSFTKDERSQRTDCVDGEEYLLLTSSGQGTGQQQLGISPYEDTDRVTFALIGSGPPNVIQVTGSQTIQSCNGGGPITQPVNSTWDDGVGALLACLGPDASGILAPDPSDPGHYAGRNTCDHRETPNLGGAHVVDRYVEWDLRRSR